MSNDQVVKLSVLRVKNAIRNLAESLHLTTDTWQKIECYFKVEDKSIQVDNFIIKDADKVCRRKKPRLELKRQ